MSDSSKPNPITAWWNNSVMVSQRVGMAPHGPYQFAPGHFNDVTAEQGFHRIPLTVRDLDASYAYKGDWYDGYHFQVTITAQVTTPGVPGDEHQLTLLSPVVVDRLRAPDEQTAARVAIGDAIASFLLHEVCEHVLDDMGVPLKPPHPRSATKPACWPIHDNHPLIDD